MNPTEQKVEQAIAREGITDADEKPIVPPKEDVKNDKDIDPKKNDAKSSKTDTGSDDDPGKKKSADDGDAKPKYDKDGNKLEDPAKEVDTKPKSKKAEKEFTADEGVEEELPAAPAPQSLPTDSTGVILSPDEQKYVVDNIGSPLTISGMRGDKEVSLQVFDPGQIPKDFQFHNQAELLSAQNGFNRLEQRAQKLLGDFRNQQSATQASDFEQRENEGIRLDVAELQKAGDFPKFKVQPGATGFDDSAEAKQMAEVMDVMNQRNQQYYNEYQQGRPYKHIGFKEAFGEWQTKQASSKQVKAQKDEDNQRSKIAERVGGGAGLTSSKVVKPTVKSGTTMRDVMARIDAGDF